jgi:hypothetical protein
MKLAGLLVGILLFGSLAQSATTCSERLSSTCSHLSKLRGPVLKRYADGTILLDQEAPRREFTGENARLLNQVNQANLPKIRALFESIKAQMTRKIESMVAGQAKTALLSQFTKIKFEARSYERCERNNNQTASAASYWGEENLILICPVLSHAKPTSLITVLAHELGHAIDLCSFSDKDLGFRVDPFSSLQTATDKITSYPFWKIHKCTAQIRPPKGEDEGNEVCGRDNEAFADYISASVTNEMIRDGLMASSWEADLSERTIEYVGFRLVCREPDWIQLGHPFVLGESVRSLLQCNGLSAATECSATDF